MSTRRRLQPRIAIDITPMIDVVLQLIIFFMITTTFRAAPGISIDLPGSSTAKSIATTALHVVVISENEIYLDKDKVTIKELPAAIRHRISGSDAAQIKGVLEAKSGAAYQLIISVLDAFRTNGVGNVGLATRREKTVQ